jgi:hypothetical protein
LVKVKGEGVEPSPFLLRKCKSILRHPAAPTTAANFTLTFYQVIDKTPPERHLRLLVGFCA